MIRLALARWQPHSVHDAELSPVVLADVTQLAPDRIATVVFDDGDPEAVDLTLTGPTHTATEASHGTDPGHGPRAGRAPARRRRGPARLGAGRPAATPGRHAVQRRRHLDRPGAAPGPRGSEPYRLVVEQFEKLGREPMKKPIVGPIAPLLTPRLVHTDIVTL